MKRMVLLFIGAFLCCSFYVTGYAYANGLLPETKAIWDASNIFELSDGDEVDFWQDRIDNHFMVQIFNKNFPRYYSDIDGSPAIRFIDNDYMVIRDSPDFAFEDENFTIHFYVKFNLLTRANTMMGQGGNGVDKDAQNYWCLMVYPDGKLRINADANGVNYINEFSTPDTVTTGQWYHIAMIRNSNKFTVFLDGRSVISKNIGFTWPDNPYLFSIGVMTWDSLYLPVEDTFFDDIYIIKGKALWDSDFIRPERAAGMSSYSCAEAVSKLRSELENLLEQAIWVEMLSE